MTGVPNLPEDFATEWRDLKQLAEAAFTAANSDKILVGKIEVFGGPPGNVPDGWLVCDGQAVSRSDFADLFGQIGTAWGAGDGSTTFNVPDLVDRVLIGAGNSYQLGETGGATSTSSDGSHDHSGNTASGGGHDHGGSTGTAGGHSHTNPSTGSAGSHAHGIAQSESNISVVGGGAAVVAQGVHDHNDTDSEPSHQHSVGNTGSVSDHGHSIGASGTSHQHGIFFGDSEHSHTATPPYAAVTPIIRY